MPKQENEGQVEHFRNVKRFYHGGRFYPPGSTIAIPVGTYPADKHPPALKKLKARPERASDREPEIVDEPTTLHDVQKKRK